MGIFNMLAVLGGSLGFVLRGTLAFFMRDYATVRHVDDQGSEHGLLASVCMLLTVPTLRWLYVGF